MTNQREVFLSTSESLAQVVCCRNTYTGDHSRHVTRFALLLGQQLHLSTEDLELHRGPRKLSSDTDAAL